MAAIDMDMTALMPLFLSCLFFVTAIHIWWHDLTVWKNAKEISGKVVGIEHYIATYNSHNKTTKRGFYQPIVAFQWNRNQYKIAGSSIGSMQSRLDDDVIVLVNEGAMGEIAAAKVKDNFIKILAGSFFMLGAFSLGILQNATDVDYQQIGLVFWSVFIPSIIIKRVLQFKPEFKQWQPKKDGRLIDTAHEQMEEVSKNTKSGFIVASVFLLIGLAMVYGAYNGLPLDGQDAVRQDVFAVIQQAIDGQIPPSWKEELILGAMGSFFSILALYSLAYTNRQSRRR